MSTQESVKEVIAQLACAERRAQARARVATTEAQTYFEAVALVEKTTGQCDRGRSPQGRPMSDAPQPNPGASPASGVGPQTQALWLKHLDFRNSDQADEAVGDFRDLGNRLETKLSAAKSDAEDQAKWASRYLARAEKAETEVARLRAENERLRRYFTGRPADLT